MSKSLPQILPTDRPFWFCLRAQTKREHFAAIGLRKQYQITCFAPRLRMRKLTRRGPSGLLKLCGKSLASFGVPAPLVRSDCGVTTPLANPTLSLRDANGN